MQERNTRIVHDGQPELTHACDKCTRIYQNDDGTCSRVEVAVIDGLTMGHPCCAEPTCFNPLPRNRNKKRYCDHHDDRHSICAIVGCTAPVTKNSMTCSDLKHSEMERLHLERGKSIFRLRQLSSRAKGIDTSNMDEAEALLDMDENEWFEVLDSGDVRVYDATAPESSTGQLDEKMASASARCEGKSETGNKKIRAQFTRQRTHNKEILVRLCGVIVARATLKSAEGVSSVMVCLSYSIYLPI